MSTDDVSISGFKDVVREQSATEIAKEAAAVAAMGTGEQDGAGSPDTVSATSQSIDEPTKDMVIHTCTGNVCPHSGMDT